MPLQGLFVIANLEVLAAHYGSARSLAAEGRAGGLPLWTLALRMGKGMRMLTLQGCRSWTIESYEYTILGGVVGYPSPALSPLL